MKLLHRIVAAICAASCLLTPSVSYAETTWSQMSLQYLSSGDYLNPFTGKEYNGDLFTLEHAASYEWGKSFIFIDKLDDEDAHSGADSSETYSEVTADLSLSYLSGSKLSFGALKDVYIAAQIEHSSAPNFSFDNYLYGIGTSWNIPGFTFFNSNFYRRNNALKSNNYQWTTAWSYPFKVADHQFYFDGFFDWESTPENGQSLVKFQPQIKYDLGALYDNPNRFLIGFELDVLRHKFGVTSQHQTALQLLLQINF